MIHIYSHVLYLPRVKSKAFYQINLSNNDEMNVFCENHALILGGVGICVSHQQTGKSAVVFYA